MNKVYRAVIVDDERLSRLELIRLLKAHPEIEVVDEAAGISEAVEKIRLHQPDLLFLDIQLRNESGFDVLNHTTYSGRVIFVTAWDHYAVRAFAVNALDYLMKPVSPERLAASLERLESNQKETVRVSAQTLDPNDVVFINFGQQMRFQRIEEILLLWASGHNSNMTTIRGQTGLVNKPLKEWEERLPASMFLRVHRNCIINLSQVSEVVPCSNFSYRISLKGWSEPVVVSRRYAKRLREILR